MRKTAATLWRKVSQWLQKAMEEAPSCRKCAVCHHVCQLLKNHKNSAKPAED